MRWSDVPRNPSPTMLRQFAALWLVVFLAMSAWEIFVRERSSVGLALAVLALTVGPLGLANSRLIRPIFVGWMVLAFPIGWTVSLVLLALVYYGVVTPVGLLLRLAGHDPLRLRRDPGLATYWVTKPAVSDVRRYFRRY